MLFSLFPIHSTKRVAPKHFFHLLPLQTALRPCCVCFGSCIIIILLFLFFTSPPSTASFYDTVWIAHILFIFIAFPLRSLFVINARERTLVRAEGKKKEVEGNQERRVRVCSHWFLFFNLKCLLQNTVRSSWRLAMIEVHYQGGWV